MKKFMTQLTKTNNSAISLNVLFLYEVKSIAYAVYRHILILHTGTPHKLSVVWTMLPASLPRSYSGLGDILYVTQRCYLANNCKIVLTCLSKMFPPASGTVLVPLKDNQLRDLHSSKDLVCYIEGEAKRHSETFQTSWNMPWINRMSGHSHHVMPFMNRNLL